MKAKVFGPNFLSILYWTHIPVIIFLAFTLIVLHLILRTFDGGSWKLGLLCVMFIIALWMGVSQKKNIKSYYYLILIILVIELWLFPQIIGNGFGKYHRFQFSISGIVTILLVITLFLCHVYIALKTVPLLQKIRSPNIVYSIAVIILLALSLLYFFEITKPLPTAEECNALSWEPQPMFIEGIAASKAEKCYTEIARRTEDVIVCEIVGKQEIEGEGWPDVSSAQGRMWHDDCVLEVATQTRNPQICESMYIQREEWFHNQQCQEVTKN